MKPYLESIRRLSRLGLILLALSFVASVVVSIQYCTALYHDNVPSITKMFSPLIAFIYAGGVVLAMDGFSFLNKRSDSDFYHSLPVSRKRLFWAITLAALTWIAATVLTNVLLTVMVFTLTKTPFVQLYALVAVPFFTIATMMVFSACAIAMSLTGTTITGLGLTILVFGLFRFVQFAVARGIVANTPIISWLDLPWYLTPVTNIATGQIAQLLRPMLRHTLYAPINIFYSAVITGAELFLARVLFEKRPSELAEHGAKSAALQTVFACAAVIPVVILFASGVMTQQGFSIPIVVGIAVGIYIIYQLVALRSAKKMMLSLPWLLVPLALGVAGYFGTTSAAKSLQSFVPNTQDVAYVQLNGANRGSEYVSYQQYLVSKVQFTETDVCQYAVETLRDNVATIRTSGYLNYTYDDQSSYMLSTQPVTFVLKDGRKFSRVLMFLNQNTLLSYCQQNSAFNEAIQTLPPPSSTRYLQGGDLYDKAYLENSAILATYYEELPQTDYPANDFYRIFDPYMNYMVDEEQNYGNISTAGYVGMMRYWDSYTIRLGMPKSSAAWMAYTNNHSKNEHLDIMQQMIRKSATLTSDMDYFNISMMVYNVPMSDGTKQTMSFYLDRSPNDPAAELKDQMQPLMNEFAEILLRSKPTTNPNDFCVFTAWGGRVHNDDGTFIGGDIIARQYASSGNSFVSGGSVYFVSNGNVLYGGISGGISAYNPSFRSFTPEDQARVIEILQQWKSKQDEYNFTMYGGTPIEGPSIGEKYTAAPTPTPAG
ncbi:MAG: hypothetical protein C0413_02715 [Clostridiales bacterium]|nr:hypothetical protein [Clostridiales bacterium]